MKETFQRWWKLRSAREQRMLLVASGLAALVLAWLLVVRPLDAGLADARQRHAIAVLRLAEARANVEALRRMEAEAPAPLGEPVDTLLNRSANEAGFPVTSVTSEAAGQARIAISAARPQALFGWVGQMEARGLIVERLSANANEDRTLAAEISFRARGG